MANVALSGKAAVTPAIADFVFVQDVSAPDGIRKYTLLNTRGNVYNVKDYGAIGDGVTDDTEEIQAAIDAASTAGGGIVAVPPGTWKVTASLTLKSHVVLNLAPAADISWDGAAEGTLFTTGGTDPIQRSGVVGQHSKISGGSDVGIFFNLRSPQFCEFSGLEIGAGSVTSIAFKVRCDVTNASGYGSKKTSCFNTFRDIKGSGQIGTVLDLAGVSGQPVTLNSFHNIDAYDVQDIGVRLVEWCDNNTFSGYQRYSLQANNAIGVILNDSATPTADVAVYANHWHTLAIDIFAGLTGRQGIVINNTKQFVIDALHINPNSDTVGEDIIDNSGVSYYIRRVARNGSTIIDEYKKGYQSGLAYTSLDVSSITIANTTTETAFSKSYTLPANSLVTGKVVRVTARGTYSSKASAAGNATVRLKLGGTLLVQSGTNAVTDAMTSRGWELSATFIVQGTGAVSPIETQGWLRMAISAIAAQEIDMEATARINFDLTADRALTITWQWSVADTGNTVSIRQLLVEVMQ